MGTCNPNLEDSGDLLELGGNLQVGDAALTINPKP